MKNINVEQFSRLWTRQLHSEFEDICWKYQISLIPPIFEISKSTRHLGSWHPESRTIKISSVLIVNRSWDVTINVLKHEICHQICSEIFKSEEAAHGEPFARACDMLGLQLEYRRASGDLPENVGKCEGVSESSQEGRRFIDKVEKLLALARSSNENEAALAMQKANEFIEKYNIIQLNNGGDLRYTHIIINRKKKRIETYQRRICSILSDFFYVKIVNAYLYDPLNDQTHKTIELLGTAENVTIAEYVYYFLENQLASLWRSNRHRYGGNARTEKSSYFLGTLKGFYAKLLRQQEGRGKAASHGEAQKSFVSLAIVENERLADYVQARFPRLRKVSRSGAKIYKSTYDEGIVEGGKMTLHKGVCEKSGNRGKMIPLL